MHARTKSLGLEFPRIRPPSSPPNNATLAPSHFVAGLEWAWRIWLEPRRLFWRYLTTNPRALYLLFNKSRPSSTDRTSETGH
jgi:hypothetical protein